MNRSRVVAQLVICALIVVCGAGAAWAIEAKSGSANETAANATNLPKDESEIGLEGGVSDYCAFSNVSGSGPDNQAYFACLETQVEMLDGGRYVASPQLFANPPYLSVMDGRINPVEPNGLCYGEDDKDIHFIEVKTTPAAADQHDLVAKIGKFDVGGILGPGQVQVFVNGSSIQLFDPLDSALLDDQLWDHLLEDLPQEVFEVQNLDDYFVISAADGIWRIAVRNDLTRVRHTLVALEPNAVDNDNSYCVQPQP